MKNFLLFVLSFMALQIMAQDCKMFYPVEEGTLMEIINYNPKGKVTGSSTQKIVEKNVSGDKVTMKIDTEAFDKNGKSEYKGEFEVWCEAGKFYIDMRNYFNNEALAGYEGMEIEVDANNMEFPSDLSVGQQLPDADITISVTSAGMAVFSTTVTIKNRMVEAQESITTDAGTFDCFKMSSEMETKMLMTLKTKSVEWFAENVGMVRSESYKNNGNLQGYSELTKLSK